jgi:epoxyqueuosine reductase
LEEIALIASDFNLKYLRSPLRRPKRRGYLRNVAIALGNHRNPQTVSALAQALRYDSEPLVRAHAAWALGQIGGDHSRPALEMAQRIETDPMVKLEIQAALAEQ